MNSINKQLQTMETKHVQPLFPWYKERLQTKYLKTPTNKPSSVSGGRFANLCLDDSGVSSSFSSVTQGCVSPLILHATPNHSSTQKPRKKINKEHACFSKQMTQKQIRREYVTAVEEKLKKHPLAMYPHYKDHMTPELFDKVASVLDPAMRVNSTSLVLTPTADHNEEDEKNCTEIRKEEVNAGKPKTDADKIIPDVQSPRTRNPIQRKQDQESYKVNALSKQ